MLENISFQLISPQKILQSGDAQMVVIPGHEGDFGVMARHAPVMSTLRPGILSIYAGGKVKESFFVTAGVVEVNQQACTVLAQEAMAVEDIDHQAAGQEYDQALELLKKASSSHQRHQAQHQVDIALAKLSIKS